MLDKKNQAFRLRGAQSPPEGLRPGGGGVGVIFGTRTAHQGGSPRPRPAGLRRSPRGGALPCRPPLALQPPLAASRAFCSPAPQRARDRGFKTFGLLSPGREPRAPWATRDRQERERTASSSGEEYGPQAVADRGGAPGLALTGSCHSQSASPVSLGPAPGGASPPPWPRFLVF